jgi:hypothetical protein
MTTTALLTQAISVFGPNVLARLPCVVPSALLDQKTMAAKSELSYEAFRWRVAKGQIPKPEIKLGKRAYYTNDQAHALEIPSSHLNTSGDHLHGGSQ